MKALSKDDQIKLILFVALLFGGIVRFLPVAMAGFPINDGGMFYVMVKELQANHFLLPAFTQYNLADIPFAYPPFGFYATALISSLLRCNRQPGHRSPGTAINIGAMHLAS